MPTTAFTAAEKTMTQKGWLDLEVDPTLDLVAEIKKLKKEKNAVILAHYYNESDIQDIADFIGDSLQLSQPAAKTEADIIVSRAFTLWQRPLKSCHPKKKVLLPDLKAGCSLADSAPAPLFKNSKKNIQITLS